MEAQQEELRAKARRLQTRRRELKSQYEKTLEELDHVFESARGELHLIADFIVSQAKDIGDWFGLRTLSSDSEQRDLHSVDELMDRAKSEKVDLQSWWFCPLEEGCVGSSELLDHGDERLGPFAGERQLEGADRDSFLGRWFRSLVDGGIFSQASLAAEEANWVSRGSGLNQAGTIFAKAHATAHIQEHRKQGEARSYQYLHGGDIYWICQDGTLDLCTSWVATNNLSQALKTSPDRPLGRELQELAQELEVQFKRFVELGPQEQAILSDATALLLLADDESQDLEVRQGALALARGFLEWTGDLWPVAPYARVYEFLRGERLGGQPLTEEERLESLASAVLDLSVPALKRVVCPALVKLLGVVGKKLGVEPRKFAELESLSRLILNGGSKFDGILHAKKSARGGSKEKGQDQSAKVVSAPSKSWEISESKTYLHHPRFGKFVKDKCTGVYVETQQKVYNDVWWSKDHAGHGGSAWKVFTREGNKMVWIADADKLGDFIVNKHKGPTGLTIPLSEFKGTKG